ncbi:uncharacterized protein [Dysidea avara]|uniref:uncharacterized protein isoform X1 n=1 Tax=Dysidea avara TaxID=196820 RepID=UPI003327245D
MGIATLLILLVTMSCSGVVLHIKDEPTCVKIDECSCRLTGVEQPGDIDLHSLVSGNHEPAFVAQGEYYHYYYNPCMNFSDYGCPETGICQVTNDGSTLFDLGNLDSVKFQYQNNSVFAVYQSENSDITRTSTVELVCDESEMKGRFVFIGELVVLEYHFKLYTRCACPGKCTSSGTVCKAKDLCSCEMSDGTGTINLHSIDNPTNPLRDEASPTNTFLYNPCSPIMKPDCKGNSLCEEQGDSPVPLGLADSASFVYNHNQLGIQYVGINDTVSTVNLLCNENQTDKPFFRAVNDANVFNLYSVCACPNGCSTQPSNGTCDQTDSCTCKSTSDGAVINLHDLDNPYAPLTAKDNEGYTYYYNPCSGIELQNLIGKYSGVAACQYNPLNDKYFSIGKNGPKIDYNATSKSFTFCYTGGDGSRSFHVRMECDHDAKVPVLAADGDIPFDVTDYPFKLISKYACSELLE